MNKTSEEKVPEANVLEARENGNYKDLSDFDKDQTVMAGYLVQSTSKIIGCLWSVPAKSAQSKDNLWRGDRVAANQEAKESGRISQKSYCSSSCSQCRKHPQGMHEHQNWPDLMYQVRVPFSPEKRCEGEDADDLQPNTSS